MAESSRFWDGTTVGDASSVAPYDAPTEFSQVMMAIAGTLSDPNFGAVFFGNPEGELALSGASSPLSMAAGQAIVYGGWYHNSSAASLVIPTPSGATRKDLIVLRKDWAAQTIRLTRVAGVEGGSVAAPVQVVGTTWDYPIGEADITTGGVVTLTDMRTYVGKPQTQGWVIVQQEFFQDVQTITTTGPGGTYVALAAGFTLSVTCEAGDRVIIRCLASLGTTVGVSQTTIAGIAIDKDAGTKLLSNTTAPHAYLNSAVASTQLNAGIAEYIDDGVTAGPHVYQPELVVKTNASGNLCYMGDGGQVTFVVEVRRQP